MILRVMLCEENKKKYTNEDRKREKWNNKNIESKVQNDIVGVITLTLNA